MRILYIAKHGGAGNDDEGAISHALRQLGHDVTRVDEPSPGQPPPIFLRREEARHAELCLFHKYDDFDTLAGLKMPKVFWYFDQVYNEAPELRNRSIHRMDWMRRAREVSDLGFLTDGDWVWDDSSGKLYWLPQGADERYVGRDIPHALNEDAPARHRGPDILFCGLEKNCGERRESFVREMRERWGHRFKHVAAGLHGLSLRKIVGAARVVVAPDFPVTDRYWSNRVYLMLGYGAFLIHPRCADLKIKELTTYSSRSELHRLIERYAAASHVPMDMSEFRSYIADKCLASIKHGHLYRHRCEQLIATVKERLHV